MTITKDENITKKFSSPLCWRKSTPVIYARGSVLIGTSGRVGGKFLLHSDVLFSLPPSPSHVRALDRLGACRPTNESIKTVVRTSTSRSTQFSFIDCGRSIEYVRSQHYVS
jgi:hypothetical protein